MRKLLNILTLLLLPTLCWGNGPKGNYPPDACGPSEVSAVFSSSGVIRLDRKMPAEVRLNEPFTYEIQVTNMMDTAVTDVVLSEQLADNYTYQSSTPSAKVEGNTLIWTMSKLKEKNSAAVKVTGMATEARGLTPCATVTFKISACANVKVVEPKLQLKKTAPAEVLVCDPINIQLIVSNNGTGATDDVRIVDTLPQGLTTTDGKREIVINAGTLTAGQSKQFNATLRAEKTGQYINKAVATAGDLTSEASTTTVVQQPVLTITKSAPEMRYLGKSITYDITVSNTGDAPASQLVVEDAVPAKTKFISATNDGKLSAGKVVWNLGTLNINEKRTVSMTVMPASIGTVRNTATAAAVCAEGVTSSASTNIAGIPAILLELMDTDDPVQIGGQTTYVIVATNQGSSPGTNIKIECMLEDNEQYVSSAGATNGSAAGNIVTFVPLPSLAAKAQATWRVTVKAVKAGDVRFTTVMTSDQLTRPVQETEATNLYE
jgi:uncharacterized repeat protein (TIGR01451 family)